MGERNDGGQAFPVPVTVGPNDDMYPAYPGMSLRDYAAFAAMPLAHADYIKGVPDWELKALFDGRTGLRREEIVARISYRYADAMLAERSRK